MNFPHGGPSVTNNAFGDARVGFQGGTINGDFYYQVVNENDPPDKILNSARESLSRGMPVPAEEKLRRLVDDGHGTNEIYYYWILAIVSGRSIDALKEQECDHLDVAYRECTHHAPDAWGTALQVVCDLIRCLVDETPDGDLRELDAVLDAYGRLPGVRQEEIWRHLDMVVNGEGKDRFDAWVAAQVRRQRMGRERLGRAWKFFEPDPEPPRRKTPPVPRLTTTRRVTAVMGAVLGAGGILLALLLIALASPETVTAGVFLLALGGAAVCLIGPRRFASRYAGPGLVPSTPREAAFRAAVAAGVERRFDQYAPLPLPPWAALTRSLRTALVNDLFARYRYPEVGPAHIDWLIEHHARTTAQSWAAGGLRRGEQVPGTLGFLAGTAALGAGGLVVLAGLARTPLGFASFALLCVLAGLGLLAVSRVDAYLVRRRLLPAEQNAAERRFADEGAAFDARLAALHDRPTDEEMARWLDFDKHYLRTLAMNQYGLTGRDVVKHAVLTEAAPGCRTARLRYGPPRHSAYVVWVFLLTRSGVRQTSIRLDFGTGIASDQSRMTFRYDAISSADVDELGIRFDGGRRVTPLSDKEERDGGRKPETELLLQQVFRLSLNNGNGITVVVENLHEDYLERIRADPRWPLAPMLHSPEVRGALDLMEAVSAEGREWIGRAEARTRTRRVLFRSGGDAA